LTSRHASQQIAVLLVELAARQNLIAACFRRVGE
jgi:hypothetical protein